MSALFNDGILPYGSRILKLTGSAAELVGTYIADQIELTRPTKAIKRDNEIGEPASAVYITDWVTGTATLQLATTASRVPEIGNTFSTTFSGSYVEKFVLNQVGQPEAQADAKKATIQFTKVIN